MVDVERELTVEGEIFRVRLREDGAFTCVWLTGPNPGYGFGSGAPVVPMMRDGSTASPSPVAPPPKPPATPERRRASAGSSP